MMMVMVRGDADIGPTRADTEFDTLRRRNATGAKKRGRRNDNDLTHAFHDRTSFASLTRRKAIVFRWFCPLSCSLPITIR